MDLNDVAYDKDKWQAVVNTVRNLGFHKTQGIS